MACTVSVRRVMAQAMPSSIDGGAGAGAGPRSGVPSPPPAPRAADPAPPPAPAPRARRRRDVQRRGGGGERVEARPPVPRQAPLQPRQQALPLRLRPPVLGPLPPLLDAGKLRGGLLLRGPQQVALVVGALVGGGEGEQRAQGVLPALELRDAAALVARREPGVDVVPVLRLGALLGGFGGREEGVGEQVDGLVHCGWGVWKTIGLVLSEGALIANVDCRSTGDVQDQTFDSATRRKQRHMIKSPLHPTTIRVFDASSPVHIFRIDKPI